MKKLENRKFEDAWKDAFSDAEADPGESVWSNIDSRLSHADTGKMRRSVVFYQRLAAASVIFAVMVVGASIFFLSDNGSEKIAIRKSVNEGVSKEATELKKAEAQNELDEGRSNSTETTQSYSNAKEENHTDHGNLSGANPTASGTTKGGFNKNVVSVDGKDTAYFLLKGDQQNILSNEVGELIAINQDKAAFVEQRLLNYPSALAKMLSKETILTSQPADEVVGTRRLSSVAIQSVASARRKKYDDENWWASIGGSAGSYNPQFGSSSSQQLFSAYGQNGSFAATAAPVNNSASSGSSYSYGMNVGKKVAPRWVLLTGVNYLTQTIGYTSNLASFSSNKAQAFVADLANGPSSSLTVTTPYEINSINEFVSVPVQAGYLVVNRQVGLQFNAGVASDFFIKNSLVNPSGQLASSSENSSYQSLNWTALMSTELSYKVSTHYRVSLVPGMRYAFNSILIPTVGSSINPLVWDVGFRFRYIF